MRRDEEYGRTQPEQLIIAKKYARDKKNLMRDQTHFTRDQRGKRRFGKKHSRDNIRFTRDESQKCRFEKNLSWIFFNSTRNWNFSREI